MGDGIEAALLVMVSLVAIVVVFIAVAYLLRWVARTGALKGLVLDDTPSTPQSVAQPALKPEDLIGRQGTAVTPLRPAGTAMFDGERIDVVTEATFTPQGATIEVTEVEGNRVIVRQVADQPGQDAPSA